MTRWTIILFILWGVLSPTCAAFGQEPRRVAFLVGVTNYDKAGFDNLTYPESDVTALGKELNQAGFVVKVMLGSATGTERATLPNLKTALLKDFIANLRQLNKRDIVLVVLSGHGQQALVTRQGQRVEDAFYCTVDSLPADPTTMLSIGDLMDALAEQSGAENNLLVVDACRDNRSKGSKGIDGSSVTITKNKLAVLFAASSGTTAHESDELKGGLLAYYLIEGLRGNAKSFSGDVTWGVLAEYAKDNVSSNASKLVQAEQLPHLVSNLHGASPILVRKGDLLEHRLHQLIVPASRKRSTDSLSAETKPGDERDDNALKMKLVYCPPGSFLMGSPESDKRKEHDEQPQHRVMLSRSFWLGKYEVTQREWEHVMHTRPWRDFPLAPEDSDIPALNVSWEDATTFCQRFTESETREGRLRPGSRYTLPTEAQWEYACRAGTTTRWSFGDDVSLLSSYAWQSQNLKQPIRVGGKLPNQWKLHDMYGNVREWCSDWYALDYYEKSPERDPTGPPNGEEHVMRGGCWVEFPSLVYTAIRKGPSDFNGRVGLRVVRIE